MFNANDPTSRIDAGDAHYVECLHTNGGANGAGIGTHICHADFFANVNSRIYFKFLNLIMVSREVASNQNVTPTLAPIHVRFHCTLNHSKGMDFIQ